MSFRFVGTSQQSSNYVTITFRNLELQGSKKFNIFPFFFHDGIAPSGTGPDFDRGFTLILRHITLG